jgi:hypothetical protein
MLVQDTFNAQFMLYHYISNLNSNILQYLDNNNININYYCFYYQCTGNIHHIITCNTDKRKDNGHRLITIKENVDTNCVREFNSYLAINFEDISIQISSIVSNINENIKYLDVKVQPPTSLTMVKNSIDYKNTYSTNTLETEVFTAHNVYTLDSLRNLPNLQFICFGFSFNQVIEKGVLPSNLRALEFNYKFNQVIKKNVLPKTLSTLIFGALFNQKLNIGVLPLKLEQLRLGYSYNFEFEINLLPSSLQTLILGITYNQVIYPGVLPDTLQVLIFGSNYNQIIGVNVLPQKINELTFGYYYNQEIGTNVLPIDLCTLSFGMKYNKEIKINVLPPKLHSITFCVAYNQIIDINVLPKSLQVINLSYDDYDLKSDWAWDGALSKRMQKVIPLEFHDKVKNLSNNYFMS